MIDSLTRRVLESYILDSYTQDLSLETMATLLELYKILTGYPFDRGAAIERRWGVRK